MRKSYISRIGRSALSGLLSFGLIAATLVGSMPGRLQAQESASLDRLDKAALKKFFQDFGDVLVSPKHWGEKDFQALTGILWVGGLSFLADEGVEDVFHDIRTPATEDYSGFISNFGDGFVLSAALLGLYAAGERAGRPSWRRMALLSLESLGSAALIGWVSKFLIGRARPLAHEGSRTFKPFSTRSAYYSFPSGHAASAWAVATTIADQSDSRTVDVIAYGLATLAAVSRVHDSKHWASDAFLGSALGYYAAKKICALNRPKLPISPTLLESAQLSFDLSGLRKSITLNVSW